MENINTGFEIQWKTDILTKAIETGYGYWCTKHTVVSGNKLKYF